MSGLHRAMVMGVLGLLLAAAGERAAAQSGAAQAGAPMADAVRGGWVADAGGARHIFVLVVRDARVTGIYCAVDCSDPARLALLDNGTLTAQGVRFQMFWPDAPGVRVDVSGRVAGGALLLELAAPSGRADVPARFELLRDPRRPEPRTVEQLFASRGVESGPLVISGHSAPYVPPGPNEPLTSAALEGLWVWSNGPGRQHFIFRSVGERMLGVVCGPCDNPWTFGPVDNGVISGDTFTFDIIHEDWGIGIEFGPYANRATATLSRRELHLRTVQQNGPRIIHGDLVLTGPLRTDPR